MKSKKKRFLCLVLCLTMCLALCVPALAANESNDKGVTFSATLDKSELQKKAEDQTVYLTIKASKSVDFDSAEYQVVCPDSLTCEVEVEPDGNDEWNSATKKFAGMTDHFGVTDIGVVKFTVPANTEGEFTLSVTNLYLTAAVPTSDYYMGDAFTPWENSASVSATLTVTDSTPAPAEGYTAGLTTADTDVQVDASVAVAVNVTQKDAEKFAASELIVDYDKDKLTFVSVTGVSDGSSSVDSSTEGKLVIEDCGADKSLGNGAYTLNFTAKATGDATVTLSSAAFSDKVNAEKADLIPATIDPASVTTTISHTFDVTIPEAEYVHGNSTVEAGDDYTLSVDDAAYYDYTVSATMGGEKATVVDNGDGTYTVEDVSGALAFEVSRQAKQFDITFTTTSGVTGLPTGVKGSYGTAYSGYTLPKDDYYVYSVTSAVYTGTANTVAYSLDEAGVLTIAGDKITGAITITVDKVHAETTVSVQGSGASDAAGYATSATTGEKYTLNVTEDAKYDYTVTAKLNDNDVTVTRDEAGKYSIAGTDVKGGAIVFTVEKALKTTGVSVSKYLQTDGTALWLVKNAADKLDGSVYTLNGSNMFWNEEYGAYCGLVIAESEPTITAADLAIVTGTVTEISGYDVNISGKVDANDAQLIYNMYMGCYTEFTADVTMQKFLLADVNASGTIDMTDVVAVISYILGA